MAERRGNYRRTVTVAVAALVVTLLTWAPAATSAQTTVSPPALPQADSVLGGVATSSGSVLVAAPGTGSLSFGITQSPALANVTNSIASGQATSADFGLIGLAATAGGCDGSDPAVAAEDLPQATIADNRNGDSEVRSAEAQDDLDGSPIAYGSEYARATRQPLAQAVATASKSEFGPVLSIGGGQVDVSAQLRPDGVIEATGSVDVDLTLAGAFDMQGMRWEVAHSTTTDGVVVADGSFDAGKIEQAGLAVPIPAETDAAEAAINSALLSSGITVVMPEVIVETDPKPRVTVTPMLVVMADSPAGAAALNPVLSLTREQREGLFDSLVEQYCGAASYLFIGDLAVGVVSGSGFLAIEVGGIFAESEFVEFTNPFAIGPASPPLPTATDAPVLTGGVTPPPPVTQEPDSGTAAPAPDGGNSEVASATVAVPSTQLASTRGTIEEFCESVHPFSWPSCSHGAAGVAGFLGMLAALGMGWFDWRHQRRSRTATAPVGTFVRQRGTV